MSDIEELELSKARRFMCNITAGAMIVIAGLFLLLCGAGAINLSVTDILAAVVLSAIGLVFLITGFIQKNNVSVWLAFVFLTPAVIEIFNNSIGAPYARLYPLYIAIPGIASFFTMLYSRRAKSHLPAIVLFFAVAGIFALQSSGLLGWAVVLPVFIVTAGLMVILYSVYKNKKSDAEEKEE